MPINDRTTRPIGSQRPARVGPACCAVVLALAATGSAQDSPTAWADPRLHADGSHSTLASRPRRAVPGTAPSDAEIAALRAEAAGQLRAINPVGRRRLRHLDGRRAPGRRGTLRRRPPRPRPPNRPPTSSSANSSRNGSGCSKSMTKRRHRLRKPHIPNRVRSSRRTTRGRTWCGCRRCWRRRRRIRRSCCRRRSQAWGEAGARPSVSAEMKEALEAATGEVKECKAKLESLRTEVANWEGLAECATAPSETSCSRWWRR